MKRKFFNAECQCKLGTDCRLGMGTACSRECLFYTTQESPKQLMHKDISTLRHLLLKKQKGRCEICGFSLIEDTAACLDHQHKKKNKGTGFIRGVICRTCNLLIAKIENNASRYRISNENLPNILIKMAEYLNTPQYLYTHPTDKPKVKQLTKLSYNKLKKMMGAVGKKCPPYPKTGVLTVKLKECFEFCNLEPEFYR